MECSTFEVLLKVTMARLEFTGRSYRMNFWAALLIHPHCCSLLSMEAEVSITSTYCCWGSLITSKSGLGTSDLRVVWTLLKSGWSLMTRLALLPWQTTLCLVGAIGIWLLLSQKPVTFGRK